MYHVNDFDLHARIDDKLKLTAIILLKLWLPNFVFICKIIIGHLTFVVQNCTCNRNHRPVCPRLHRVRHITSRLVFLIVDEPPFVSPFFSHILFLYFCFVQLHSDQFTNQNTTADCVDTLKTPSKMQWFYMRCLSNHACVRPNAWAVATKGRK